MKKITLTKKQARKLALISQGLHKKNPFGKGKNGVLKTVQALSYVQIDTISVIERAHHHVLGTRVDNYAPKLLEQLHAKEKRILEYWGHAAAYLPMDDYRFCIPQMNAWREGRIKWFPKDETVRKFCLDRIKAEGELMARDFKPPENHKSGPWWNWKPAKIALEQLFNEGELTIVRRQGFQKVYDLTERAIPSQIDTTPPTTAEFSRYLIARAMAAHGVVNEAEIKYLRRKVEHDVAGTLKQMLNDGEIVEASIEGLPGNYYTTQQKLELLNKRISPKNIFFLSPFDNLIIQRKRTAQFFDFNYQIECYVPAPKRVFGYFCLPILWGDVFVGRMDTKADRKSKTFIIKNFFIENPDVDFEEFLDLLVEEINNFAKFNGCDKVVLENAKPLKAKRSIVKLLN